MNEDGESSLDSETHSAEGESYNDEIYDELRGNNFNNPYNF